MRRSIANESPCQLTKHYRNSGGQLYAQLYIANYHWLSWRGRFPKFVLRYHEIFVPLISNSNGLTKHQIPELR